VSAVLTGLEVALSDPPPVLTGRRLGLLTNPSGIDRRFRSTIELFSAHQAFDLRALFGPEHGIRGEAQAGAHVSGESNPRTGLPVHSLYGATRALTPGMLEGIDTLVIDLQDIGVRFTTYISTIAYALTACDGIGMPVVILDRPNPLGGARVAGSMLEPACGSFIGIHTIPTLHGLTAGEFARLWCRDNGLADPTVVPMRGWRRSLTYDGTGLPWVLPSPNLPTLDSVRVYPGTCLIEGTTLSEGRGTTRPFEMIGAPWVEPKLLADRIACLDLPGVAARPVYFVPAFSKHQGERCGGVQIHVTDVDAFDAVAFGPRLLAILRQIGGARFAWLPPTGDRHFIDLLCGTDAVRLAIDSGAGVEDLIAGWDEDVRAFRERCSDILLYDDAEPSPVPGGSGLP
jgi:uncharacterized protein YbbC (DUF1343 family)